MNTNIIRAEISKLEAQLDHYRRELAQAEKNCQHDWSLPVAAHIYTEAYTIPGDAPGTCGIDWRGPVHVPAKTTQRWRRICRECGKEEFTSRVEEKVAQVPMFS